MSEANRWLQRIQDADGEVERDQVYLDIYDAQESREHESVPGQTKWSARFGDGSVLSVHVHIGARRNYVDVSAGGEMFDYETPVFG